MKKTTRRAKLLSRKFFLVSVFLMSFTRLSADWDPEYCLADAGTDVFKSLDAQDFKDLKKNVAQYLATSWCSAEKVNLFMDLVVATKPNVCVEIGAFTGSSVLPVAVALKYLGRGKIFAVDAWSNAEMIKNLDLDDPNRPWWSTVDMKAVHDIFKGMVKEWSLEKYCIGIHSPSAKAIEEIDQIDFLHIDGDYSEKGSVEDINLYLPKVKSGGYVVLSNLFTMINGKQPKLKAFCLLFDACEMICEIENDNTVIFRKL